jgi:putative ABC transport system ATP-binding protein
MIRVDGRGDSSSLIKVRGLNKTYSRGGEKIQVLQGLNLDVDKGDFVAFMGPSGSGKTTLLNLLGGLDVPSAGSITVDGDEITHMSGSKLTHWRARHVGFIFQMYNLIPVLTAYQNVELPLLLTKLSKSERRKHVETALGVVNLADRMHHYPRQLSGGQEQRVTIARAIVSDPTFLLCDEPTGDLDRKSADEIMALIDELVGKYNKTILMVTIPSSPLARTRLSISKKEFSSRASLLRRASWQEVQHEISPAHLCQSLSQENSVNPHDRLFRHRAGSLHVSRRGPERIQPRRGNCGCRPSGNYQPDRADSDHAHRIPGQNPDDPGREGRHPQ